MAAKKRARRKTAKRKPAVSTAVLNRTKAIVREYERARRERAKIDFHLKKIGAYLHKLLTHQHGVER